MGGMSVAKLHERFIGLDPRTSKYIAPSAPAFKQALPLVRGTASCQQAGRPRLSGRVVSLGTADANAS